MHLYDSLETLMSRLVLEHLFAFLVKIETGFRRSAILLIYLGEIESGDSSIYGSFIPGIRCAKPLCEA